MDTPAYSVATVLRKFLEWCQRHRAERTHEWYSDHLAGFLSHLGEAAAMPAAHLRPFHVVEWADGHPSWSDTYRRGAIVSVQRPFNWAEEMGYIAASPIKKIRKPGASRRDNPVTPADFRTLLARVKESDPFRDLLQFCWHTGCRPQEARHIEPRYVSLAEQCIVIPREEAKGKRKPRVILLHAAALEIVSRLLGRGTGGKLFRNSLGEPWTRPAVCGRFQRLAKKIGKGFAAYDLRHGFCQRLLESGVNHLAVAELLGHTNGQMVAAVYSHMNRAAEHLREALNKGAN